MNAAHPLTYHVVKAEEAHRMARIERRAQITAAQHSSHEDKGRPSPAPVQRRSFVPRAVGVALATVALVLSLVAGGVLANSAGGSGGGGGTRISLQ